MRRFFEEDRHYLDQPYGWSEVQEPVAEGEHEENDGLGVDDGGEEELRTSERPEPGEGDKDAGEEDALPVDIPANFPGKPSSVDSQSSSEKAETKSDRRSNRKKEGMIQQTIHPT